MPRPWPAEPGFATSADLAACREMLREGSRTFFMASLLLPRDVRDPAGALYAFCRQADDAVDLGDGRAEVLDPLRERLERAYAGRPTAAPVDRAFADVVARHAIPRALPEALFEGFEWDAVGRRYEGLTDLYAYAARVAASVGAMMTMLMGRRDPDVVARACDLGVAMQLSNIARDVGEDARAGRLYLPRQWLRDAGIDPDAWLARPVFDAELGAVVQRLLDAADLLYARSICGIARLPAGCRPGIHAARLLYAEIGRVVERQGLDSIGQRAVVPTARKLALLGHACAAAAVPWGRSAAVPPLAEVQFLVDAAGAPRGRKLGSAEPVLEETSRWHLDDRMAWVIGLFERLERRERSERDGRAQHLGGLP